jgi:hypothetical protein
MLFDPFIIIYQTLVLTIFGSGLVLSVVFTFAINTFLEWEHMFQDVDALSRSIMDPVYRQVHWFEEWLVVNHNFFGFCCILCFLWEIITLFSLASKF